MKISYNAPTILTFSILAVAIQLISTTIFPNINYQFFSVAGEMNWSSPLEYLTLISHIAGHSNWNHLFSNITFILLLGPILEEKHGSTAMLLMILATAIITGLLNVLIFDSGLLGASGIVFMLITLISFSDIKNKQIPITFILVSFIFIGSEIINIFNADNVSQATHIIGAVCGAIFGFMVEKRAPAVTSKTAFY